MRKSFPSDPRGVAWTPMRVSAESPPLRVGGCAPTVNTTQEEEGTCVISR